MYNFNLQWLMFYFWDSYYIFSYQQALLIGTYHLLVGEGNGNPLHYSCLEDSLHRGARQAAVHGVAQSRTRMKQLSTPY